jgi:hypothetical protein
VNNSGLRRFGVDGPAAGDVLLVVGLVRSVDEMRTIRKQTAGRGIGGDTGRPGGGFP